MANGLVRRYGKGTDSDATDTLVANTLKSQAGKGGSGIGPEHTFLAAPLTKGSAAGEGVNALGRRQEDDVNLVTAFSWQQGDDSKWTDTGRGRSWVARAGDYAAGMSASGRHDAIAGQATGVRRLTPTECERLQSWPDGWTNPTGDAPDSRRYAACGDGVTASVAEWIGRRMMAA